MMIKSEHTRPLDSPFLGLNDVLSLLRHQGYTESFLDPNHRSGMIAATLKRAVAAVSSTTLPAEGVGSFILETPGRFDSRQDLVSFGLHMCLEPSSNKLRIRRLVAKLNPTGSAPSDRADSGKLYFFQHTRNLVHAADVYADLREARITNVLLRYPGIAKINTVQKSLHI